jgi:ribulose-5-phosphate 4-epimerase/fuculose-1-phosphate aldolase
VALAWWARSNADGRRVVHTDLAAAVALSSFGVSLRPIFPADLARLTATVDLILDAELGQRVACRLIDRNACLPVNHGTVVAAPDVPSAVVTTCLFDRGCRMQLTAMAAGRWPAWSTVGEAFAKREHCYPEPPLRADRDYLLRRLPG